MVEDISIIDLIGVIKGEDLIIGQEDNILNMINLVFCFIGLLILFIIICFIDIKFNRKSIILNSNIVKNNPFYIGYLAEKELISSLKNYGIDSKDIFHNLYVRNSNGKYAQIDVAALTSKDLIVFEVKNYSGWIYGSEDQPYWTKVLGRKKYRFYNPIMQNAEHIRALRQNLPQNPSIPIYSIVVFYGSAKLKNISCSSHNTYLIYSNSICDVLQSIKNKTLIKDFNREEVWNVLNKASKNSKNPFILCSHLNSIKKYLKQIIFLNKRLKLICK